MRQFQATSKRILKKLVKLFKEHKNFNPDIVVLPELWSVGTDYQNFHKESEFIPEQTTMLLSGLAQEYNTNIIGGSIIEKTFDGKYYNTALVFDRNGAVIAQYRKNHTFSHCGSKESEYLSAGTENCIIDIEGLKTGIAICYDIRFPEQFRDMVKNGAELFIVPAAFPEERKSQWKILNKARALENLAILISCNQFGNSMIVSPYGKVLEKAANKDCAIKYTLKPEIIHKARKETPFLDDIK